MRLMSDKCSDWFNSGESLSGQNEAQRTKNAMTLDEAFAALANGIQVEETDVDASVRSQLADYGVESNKGVLSLEQSEFLNAATIESGLTESSRKWLRRLDVLASTKSTNTDLLELSRANAIDGWVRTAEVQTGGRGRRGRRWVSPFAKNVALSVGISIDRSAAEIGTISLAIGLLTAQMLDAVDIDDVNLKWPNDVLIGQRKVGGILIELADAERPALLVVGIGINVNNAPGIDVTGRYRATCVSDHLASCSRNVIVAGLVNSIHEAVQKFEEFGFDAFKERWERRDVLRNRQIAMTGVEPPITGIGIGIDNEGAYLIQTDSGIERAIGGELSLRPR